MIRIYKKATAGLVAAMLMFSCMSMSVFAAPKEAEDTENAEAEEQSYAIPTAEELAEAGAKVFELADDADFTCNEKQFLFMDELDEDFAPSEYEICVVKYQGELHKAYYWEPGDRLILYMRWDQDPEPLENLTEEDINYWIGAAEEFGKGLSTEDYYFKTQLVKYLFTYNTLTDSIDPYIEFRQNSQFMVLSDYTIDQDYFLEPLSKSWMQFGEFTLDVYQYLMLDDDSFYYVLSGMDKDGNTYLYLYDLRKDLMCRMDNSMLTGLRYLNERTWALRDAETQIAMYQDRQRKMIAGAIIAVVVLLFAFINVKLFRRMKTKREDEEEGDDYYDYEEAEDADEPAGVITIEDLPETSKGPAPRVKKLPPVELEDEEAPEEELREPLFSEPEPLSEEPKKEDTPEALPEIQLIDFDDETKEEAAPVAKEEAEEKFTLDDVFSDDVEFTPKKEKKHRKKRRAEEEYEPLDEEEYEPDHESSEPRVMLEETDLFYAEDTEEIRSQFIDEDANIPTIKIGGSDVLDLDNL